MTNFERLVSAGPEALARLIVDSKITFAEAAVNSFIGGGYKTDAEVRNDMINHHYILLTTEVKE